MSERRRTLRATSEASGSRHLEAYINADGDLVIEGQDLGAGVKEFFGVHEYEWEWTVRSHDVPRLLAALDATQEDDVLERLAIEFSGEAASDVRPFLERNGVPFEAWSRLGD